MVMKRDLFSVVLGILCVIVLMLDAFGVVNLKAGAAGILVLSALTSLWIDPIWRKVDKLSKAVEEIRAAADKKDSEP